MSLPLPKNELPKSIRRFANPEAPEAARTMAARGLVPVKGDDLVAMLVQLAHDPVSAVSTQAKDTLLNLQPDSGVELVILRPSNTLGKRDTSALPALLAGHEKGSFAVIGGGDWHYSCTDARDVGRAMVHLLTVPVSGPEIFLVAAYNTTWLAVKEALDTLLGRKTKLLNIPKGFAMALGWLMEKLYPYGKNPPLTRFSVEVLSTHTLFDDSKLRATGFEPRYSLEETLSDALDK